MSADVDLAISVPSFATVSRQTATEEDEPVTAKLAAERVPAVAVTFARAVGVANVVTDPDGFTVTAPRIVIVSAAVATNPCLIVAVIRLLVLMFIVVAAAVGVTSVTTDEEDSPAFAGITETRPKPNADTATSAMRLRSVFVDICFLSISRSREFPDLGFG
jgi:hypothetical protein